MKRRAIELHDSSVTAVARDDDAVVLDLEAYVHQSEGEPGVDAGTGWEQPVRIVVRNARIEGPTIDEPWTIWHGRVVVGGARHENCLPLPWVADGTATLTLEGIGGPLTIAGDGIRVEATGEARYVETFPGHT